MDIAEFERARDIVIRYGGSEYLTPVATERDILLFGSDSVLLVRRESNVYYISHLFGLPREWFQFIPRLASELKARGEEKVAVRLPAKHPITQFFVRRYPDRFKLAGDFYESTAELWL